MIENTPSLLSHGNITGRRAVLDIIEAALPAADPYAGVRRMVRLEGDTLVIGTPELSDPPGRRPLRYKLDGINNIYIVGGGKAVQRMARALEDVLGDRITAGHVNIKQGSAIELDRIEVTLAAHPLPDENSVSGARRIVDIMENAREGDIVFWLQSGGGTSLLALPSDGIGLEDLRQVSQLLYFGAGASMPETNSVRNLISCLNTRHTKYVRGATLVYLVTDELPRTIKAHHFPPPGSDPYGRAISVLKKYAVWDRVPPSVRDFMLRADPRFLPPTEAELTMRPYYPYRVMTPEHLIEAARFKAESMGLNTAVLATSLNDVEAKPAGELLAGIAREAEALGRPLKPPCVFILGGEVVVPIGNETGLGGRNQELVLSAADRIAGSQNIVIASVDSDGTDGPTDVAGGIVDGHTLARLEEMDYNLTTELKRHNSYPVLEALGDTVHTGNTGTNLRDLRLVYVGKA